MNFHHVNYLWDDQKADAIGDDQIALFLYRSNILGADLRITNYGGGNTSCKTTERDPLTGNPVEVMWVKGSGGDIGTLTRKGIAGLYVEKLHQLKNRYRGIAFEDEIVGLQLHCLYDLDSAAPSIDTPLHGLLPFKHIDHLHPDAAIAIAAAKDSRAITQEIWGDTMGWVPWQRPGFDLGLQLEKCLTENPGIRGIVLGGHGLFTWGDTSKECYINSLEVIEQASVFIENRLGKSRPVFGGAKTQSLNSEARRKQAAAIAPILRGLCSESRITNHESRKIGHFTDDERVLEFINSNDLERLAPLGTSCPDHFLRTKIQPMVLQLSPTAQTSEILEISEVLAPQFEQYRAEYAAYYDTCKHPNSPAMRDPNPVVILWPGVGMFTFAKDKQTARVAAEFYINAINVMRGAEAISEYTALPRQEAFDIEYWLLEEAKLQRMPKPKPLSGRVALVTGSGGGIGLATAKKLAAEGACVVLNDIDEARLAEAKTDFQIAYGNDKAVTTLLNVTNSNSVADAFEAACLAFGGVDIVVNNAGISISKGILEHSVGDWDKLQDILVKGQFLVSQASIAVMRKQRFGGDIVNIVSKNAVVAGPNNVGYGTAKAAQAHMTRLLAAELGPDKIRVNMVNPDAVIAGSNIWAGGWAEGRAKAYGVTVEELPAYYAKRTLLGEIILPEDIANAVFALVGGLLNKSTGNALNVDGGVAMGFLR
ncbi:MAG: bifunctional aldolase/short-chain dehydrogenase [Saprospiraceae bacterium]|nr:bifunctional aldolase/short-chain dehydrogenase [Saprospiraceae bacterium]